jgi:hypothetical protein
MFRGFDTSQYPGDAEMTALKPYFDFCGFYLRAPSRQDQSWVNKRAFLAGLGYGFVPIFVAQETIGPGSHIITPLQGAADGQEAVDAMASAGFTIGSRVFQDLENGAPFGQPEQAYVTALQGRVKTSGDKAGIYASHSFIGQALLENLGSAGWVFKIPTTTGTTSPLPLIDLPSDMSGSGCPTALVWQYRQNVTIQIPGHGPLLVDLNCSLVADPSAPGVLLDSEGNPI